MPCCLHAGSSLEPFTAESWQIKVLLRYMKGSLRFWAVSLQTRMQRLEGVRLEVDSRRRTVAELARKIDRQRARLPQTRSKGEFEMEQTIKKMQHKENKLSGAHKLRHLS